VNLGELKCSLRLAYGSLGLAELAFGLCECGLEGARVDLEEDLTLLDDGTLAVVLLDEVAGDLRLNVCVDEAVDSAHPLIGDGDAGLLDGDDVNRHRPHGGCSRLSLIAAGEEHGCESGGRSE